MWRSKNKEIKIKGFKVVIVVSIPNELNKIFPDYINLQDSFLDDIIKSTSISLKHNNNLIDSNKNIIIRFEDWGDVGSGFTASGESSLKNFVIRGSLRDWFNEYIYYFSSKNIKEFIQRIMVILIHEMTHCSNIKSVTAQKAIEKLREDREKSLLLYLAWNLERQHDEGLAIIRQAHTLTEKGYYYRHHHDFRDHTLYMKNPSDFEDKKWVKFWKDVFPRGLSNIKDMVLDYRRRTENFYRSFHLNKYRYEKSNLKGFAFNYAYQHGYYNYPLGTMMCYFIFIANLRDQDLDIIDFDTRQKILKKDVAKRFIKGYNIAIGRIEHRKFKRIFRKIKRLDLFDFYKEYESSCIVLGIPKDYMLISSKHIKELNSKKKEMISWMK